MNFEYQSNSIYVEARICAIKEYNLIDFAIKLAA